MNLLQNLVDAVLGAEVLDLSQVDPNLLFCGCLFMGFFAYLALRSLVRTFLNIRF